MSKLFIVIKDKKTKKLLGAIPSKPKATKSKLNKFISLYMGKKYSGCVMSEPQIKKLLLKSRRYKIRSR